MTKLWVLHEQVSVKPMHKVLVRTVTLTFDLTTWFLFATHRLFIMIICAKLIFKSHHAGQTYRPDTILEHTIEQTKTHTNIYTHTDRVNSSYMLFRHFMAWCIKMSNHPPLEPIASTVSPCPIVFQMNRSHGTVSFPAPSPPIMIIKTGSRALKAQSIFVDYFIVIYVTSVTRYPTETFFPLLRYPGQFIFGDRFRMGVLFQILALFIDF